MARCDSGARSPVAPTEPICGTTGTMPALSMSARRLQGLHADAGMPAQQRVDADRQHRPHHIRRERFAHAHRVGDDQIVLQLVRAAAVRRLGARQLVAQRMRAEQLVGIAAEAGGDAIDRLFAARPARPGNRRARDPVQRASSSDDAWRHRPTPPVVRGVSDCAIQLIGIVMTRPSSPGLARPAAAPDQLAFDFELFFRRRSFTLTTPRCLVLAEQHHEADPALIGVLELLGELRGFQLHFALMPAARSCCAMASDCGRSCLVHQCRPARMCSRLSASIRPASRNCQNRRVAPMEMPTPGSFDLV